jgi:hypothetical protein
MGRTVPLLQTLVVRVVAALALLGLPTAVLTVLRVVLALPHQLAEHPPTMRAAAAAVQACLDRRAVLRLQEVEQVVEAQGRPQEQTGLQIQVVVVAAMASETALALLGPAALASLSSVTQTHLRLQPLRLARQLLQLLAATEFTNGLALVLGASPSDEPLSEIG